VIVAEPGPAGVATRLRLDLSYDGTEFAGWAVQPGLRTVAGTLGDALAVLLRGQVGLVVAGRTDAGVHALGQVAHIDVEPVSLNRLSPRGTPDPDPPLAGLLRRLAGVLPADVRVRRVSRAPAGFDARFSALRRHYRYRIATAPWGADPLDRVGVLARPRPLDAERMQRAAAALIGLHDFAAYCRPRAGSTTVRDLQELTVSGSNDQVVIEVTADAFCHSMVRSLVGALIGVGEGRLEVVAPARVLAARSRTAAVHTAPPGGLTLVAVDYPPDAELSSRAATTRAVRAGVPKVSGEGTDPAVDGTA
jgi:tRNA pseudouridine38-40 synthase